MPLAAVPLRRGLTADSKHGAASRVAAGKVENLSLSHENAAQFSAEKGLLGEHTADMPHICPPQPLLKRSPRTGEVLAWAGIPARSSRVWEKSNLWRRRQEQHFNLRRALAR